MADATNACMKLYSYIFGILDIEFLFQLNSMVFPYTKKQSQEERKEVLTLLCIIYKKIRHGRETIICSFTILTWKVIHEI